jgi:signal transduction histidine kinase
LGFGVTKGREVNEFVRQTGIEPLGAMPWGAHMCVFYETKQDALDTLVPYFKTGLQSDERCVWVVSEPLEEEDARAALIRDIPDTRHGLAHGAIEILPGYQWYMRDGRSDSKHIIAAWEKKMNAAVADGFEGLRISGNAFWMQTRQWAQFTQYEQEMGDSLAGWPMLALCTYWLKDSTANDLIDVVRAHQFTIARRHGEWDLLEAPELRQAKQEILILKGRLEQRVAERTQELAAANEKLKTEYAGRQRVEAALERAQTELAKAERLTSVSVLAGSIAHEINQPLTGIVTNSEASLRWLTNNPPEIKQAMAGLVRIARDANRAADVIKRIRALVSGKTDRLPTDINKTIQEVAVLMRGTLRHLGAEIRLDLSPDLPSIPGDRLQLQQAVINLVINGAEAMADTQGPREILIRSRLGTEGGVVVTIEDHGAGLKPETISTMFDPFVTTKADGMGLGLSIARSVVEAHGGSLSAAEPPSGGTVFRLTLPSLLS